MVMRNFPASVGMPLMSPDSDSVKPAGKSLLKVHDKPTSPNEASRALYESPLRASGRKFVVITAGSLTMTVKSRLAVPRSFEAYKIALNVPVSVGVPYKNAKLSLLFTAIPVGRVPLNVKVIGELPTVKIFLVV